MTLKAGKYVRLANLRLNMALSSKSVRTPAFHAGNPGSNPGSVTKEKQKFLLTKQMCGYFETLNETLRGYHGFVS